MSNISAQNEFVQLLAICMEDRVAARDEEAEEKEHESLDMEYTAAHWRAELARVRRETERAELDAAAAAAAAAAARALHAEAERRQTEADAEGATLIEMLSLQDPVEAAARVPEPGPRALRWLEACEAVREAAEERDGGIDLPAAVVADGELAALPCDVDARHLGGAPVFLFAEPPAHGVPSARDVERAIAYLKTQPRASPTPAREELARFVESLRGTSAEDRLPRDLNKSAVRLVQGSKRRVALLHPRLGETQRRARERGLELDVEMLPSEDEGSGSESEDEFPGAARPPRQLSRREAFQWRAVARSVEAHRAALERAAAAAVARPREASSPIAVFNTAAHYSFESPEAQGSVGALDDAVRSCCLRERPTSWLRSEDGRKRLPLPIRTYAIDSMSIEGDLIAVTGDARADEIRASGPYVGCLRAPRVDVEAAETMDDLRDAAGNNPYDTPPTRCWKNPGGRCWASAVAAGGKVWAADVHHATGAQRYYVAGFDPAERARGAVARMDFPEAANAYAEDLCNWRPSLCRAGEAIVGALGNNTLCVWSTASALARGYEAPFPRKPTREERRRAAEEAMQSAGMELPSDYSDPDEDEEEAWSSDDSDGLPRPPAAGPPGPPAAKRPKVDYGPDAVFAVGQPDLHIGDVVQLADSASVAVAPADTSGFDASGERTWTTIRVADVDAGATTRLLAGHRRPPRLLTQLIENLVFSFEPAAACGLVFDVRAARPAFVLPKCGTPAGSLGGSGCMLGVPLPGGAPAAFTAASDECVRCWDLRQPASHAYLMSTGNLSVVDMHWHAPTASLFAVTDSAHAVSQGRCGAYRYGGHRMHEKAEDAAHAEGWPPRAHRSWTYFPEVFNLSAEHHFRYVLQYAFDDGRPMAAAR